MAYADLSTYSDADGDGSIIGSFREKEFGNLFEFSANPHYVDRSEDLTRFLLEGKKDFTKDYPHLVWVMNAENPMRKYDQGFRYAKVMKTRAHVIVDEDENGEPVIEVWKFKQNSKKRYIILETT